MSALLDGLSVAAEHWQLVTGILLVVATCQILLYSFLRRIFEDKLAPEDFYALSLAGWPVAALLLAAVWYGAARIASPQIGSWIVLATVVGLGLWVRVPRPMAGATWHRLALPVFLTVLFFLLRLAFVSRALLPLYFDSAQHYRFIAELLSGLQNPGAETGFLSVYYHLGLHFLVAFITSLTHAEVTDTMLVLGQTFLATMPFSAFFIVRHSTHSTGAGWFTLLLAAFGWYMPAHAVDWGKYPALASLALIPFVLALAFLSLRHRNALSRPRSRSLAYLFAGAGLASLFLHSRSLIVLVIAGLAWGTSQLVGRWRGLLFLLSLLAVAGEIFYILSRGILGPLFDPYGVKAVLVTAPVLLLSAFAWRPYPSLVAACFLSAALLIASLFVPIVNVIPGFANTTLLDRPYVEMILYMPLALLGGLGLAALEQRLHALQTGWENNLWKPARIVGAMFIALVVIHAWFKYDLYPSDCCAIASEDDLTAIRWMGENLPDGSLILTSSTALNVLPTDEYQGSAGGDAGTWITPLTGRPTISLPFHTDFSQQQTLDTLCQAGVDYVYVGQTGYYFSESGMPVQPEGYRIVFALPKARIYRVTGCK